MSGYKKSESKRLNHHQLNDLPVHEIFAKFSQQNALSPGLTAIAGISQITKILSNQLGNYNHSRNIIGSNLSDNFFIANKIAKQLSPLYELSKTLNEVKFPYAEITKNLAGIGANQLEFSRNLSKILTSINVERLNHFSGFETAIQNISNNFIDRSIKDRDWENLNFAQEVTESISSEADNLVNNTENITLDDLKLFENNVLQELNSLLSKTKSQKAISYITHLITIISFILNLYLIHKDSKDYNNKEVLSQTKKHINNLNSNIDSKFNEVLSKLDKNRIALRNVQLRAKSRKKSQIIGDVHKGQIVTVIEIRHKYLLIVYIDKQSKEPKSGFVVKKYFDIVQ